MFRGTTSWLLAALIPALVAGVTAETVRGDTVSSDGVLAAANGPVEVVAPDNLGSGSRRIAVGARIGPGDEIVTLTGVRAQVMMRDGTTFAIGENASLVIDEYAYDPESGRGALGAIIRRGSFRFVSGRIAKTSPGNVKLIAGNTAISVNGTEVLGTINGVSDQVILMSGEVNLTSMGGDCGGAAPSGDMFSINQGGDLQSNAETSAAAPASCNRSLVRSGFGIQVGASGQMSSPGRVAVRDVDNVIDAVTVKAGVTPAVPQITDVDIVTASAADEGVPASADADTTSATGGLSKFDRIVMRSFGMLDEASSSSTAKPEDTGEEQSQIQLAAIQSGAADDGKTEVEKADGQLDSADVDGKMIVEEEERYDDKVEEAVREKSETGDSASSTTTNTTTNASPQLASITGMAFTDTSGDDSFSNETGALSATDSDSDDTLTYAITGQSADSSQSGFTHARAGTFGTLYINSVTGVYRYIPNDSAVEGATTNQADSFTVSVSDGTASASQTLTATVGGVNDTPVLTSLSGISFTDTSGDDSFSAATATASGSDRDSSDTLIYSITGQSADSSQSGYTHSASGTYGTLYINSASGAYTYVPNDSAVEGLKSQQTESFTVNLSDGTVSVSQTLTATLTGVDDTPSLVAPSAITVTDTAADDSFSATLATLSASERDTADSLSFSVTGQSADTSQTGYTHSVSGTYGTLYINSSSGAYKYVPDESAIEPLNAQQSESFTVIASDGANSASQTLTTTLAGTNDTPVLASLSGISFTDTSSDDSFSAATATASGSDRDSGDTLTYAITGQSADTSQSGYTHAASGSYGTLYIDSASGAYKYIPNDSAIEALTSQQTDSFTLTASDGTATASQNLTATIAGANDDPSLAAISGLTFTDTSGDDSFSDVTASLTANDRDTSDTLTFVLNGGSADTSQSGYTHAASGTYGTLYINSASGAYKYIPNDSAIEGTTSTRTESFGIGVSDGTSNASQTLTTTINGVDDVPVLASLSGITKTDTANDDSFSSDTASMSATERDSGDTLTYGISGGSSDTSRSGYSHSLAGTYGTVYINNSSGAYEYVPNDATIQRLTSQATEDFTLTVTDGTSVVRGTLSTTLEGVNDAPAITSLSSIGVTDTSAYDSFSPSTGTMSASERDAGQSVSLGVSGTTSSSPDAGYDLLQQGSYGYLEFNTTSGAYRYTPTAVLVNALASSKTDTFSLTASDGSLTSSETLTVNVTGVDDGPKAIDTTNLTSASNRQNTGQTGLRIATTSDPEGDTVTDLSPQLNTLPAWLSFNNQTTGGVVEYFWEIGANEAPWRNGSRTLSLQAQSSSINTAATSVTINFVCQSDHCADFLKSTDTVTSPTVYDATDIGQIRSGMKIAGQDFILLSSSQRDTLFDTTTSATGSFRLIYSTAETGSGSPSGTWNFDQTVSVDYKNRKINLSGSVDASNITYFNGNSDQFTYSTEMTYSDIQAGTTAVFESTTSTAGSGTYSMKNNNGDRVDINLTDEIGFMIDASNNKAAVINTAVNPLGSNPTNYNDSSRNMVAPQWQVLEPQ